MNKKTFKEKFITGNPFTKTEGHFSILPNGYRFNQYIFYLLIGVVLSLGVLVFYNLGWSTEPQIYYKCDSFDSCINPFNKDNIQSTLSDEHKDMCIYEWCNKETLPGGFEFGRKPTYLERNFGIIAVLIITLGFIINHFLYNRDYILENKVGGF